jgi:hypothetical protein
MTAAVSILVHFIEFSLNEMNEQSGEVKAGRTIGGELEL